MSCARAGCAGTIEDGYCNVCGLAEASPAGSGRTTSSRTASSRTRGSGPSRRGMLGAGLVEVPAVPYRDPAGAILADAQVAEHKRFCGSCGEPVGRARNGLPGRTEGFCSKCRSPYSFTPKLTKGDLVGGQYEVLGCLAHGGLGWIYLARDKNVSDRWVVLKGLLNTGDADAMAAALAERRFLAEVEHPNVVKIYNFAQHATGGYIVMEYVGGQSLRQLRETGPLPLPQVIAYGLEILRAFGYLHDQGLLYCDLKPDNVLQSQEQLKLIDLGGVRRIDDEDGAIYGTVGYQAPEIAERGPSVASDLYTVGRTLAVLSFDFRGNASSMKHALPDVLPLPESFALLLRRATDPDPELRFWSAADLAEQLTGVLREVVAAQDGRPRPAASTLFGPEIRTARSPREALPCLPGPLPDPDDPAAALLAGLASASPEQALAALPRPETSIGVRLRTAWAHIELGAYGQARTVLTGSPDADWRVDWQLGLAALAAGDPGQAATCFWRVRRLFPGEPVPKLALAFCAELSGDPAEAARLYESVWRTDHGYVSAAFGLARVLLAKGDRAAAVAVLDSVPATSIHFVEAQMAAISARVGDPRSFLRDDLLEAGRRLETLGLDAERREHLAAEVLEAALTWVRANGAATETVLGAELSERELRFGLERAYRALAHLTHAVDERIALVDRANAVRPRTLR
ncbi:tetratricopeptide repeat protein [Nonomuraea sp. NPDC050153]|uniref:serine/threonine-protein kinase n=1 Tax=Nonomuraea sp. NPDC050153 TaxID=3364359 RepID=UPI0037B42D2C